MGILYLFYLLDMKSFSILLLAASGALASSSSSSNSVFSAQSDSFSSFFSVSSISVSDLWDAGSTSSSADDCYCTNLPATPEQVCLFLEAALAPTCNDCGISTSSSSSSTSSSFSFSESWDAWRPKPSEGACHESLH